MRIVPHTKDKSVLSSGSVLLQLGDPLEEMYRTIPSLDTIHCRSQSINLHRFEICQAVRVAEWLKQIQHRRRSTCERNFICRGSKEVASGFESHEKNTLSKESVFEHKSSKARAESNQVMNILIKAMAVVAVLLASSIDAFKVARTNHRHKSLSVTGMKSKAVSNTKLNLDATLVPMIIGATGLIFAVFNFDNKIDLTDSGMAKAKAIRYNERKERGEIPSKEALARLDPYRWGADEDEEVDILTPKKKKGGGCG